MKLNCLIIKYMNASMSFFDWCMSNDRKELIDEFDLKMNAPLTTKDIYPKSNKKYYWKCPNGHSFLESPFHRIMGYECNICKPHIVKKCNHGKITTKENGLAARRPDLLKYWDYDKNVGIDPAFVSCDSRQEYYWKCPKGHSYKTSTHVKFAMSGCPICLNKKVVVGLNDLATTHKELLKEWDYEKNIDISPTEVVAGSSKKVWWKCEEGHSWQAEIRKRTIFHQGCRFCAAKKRFRKIKEIKTLMWWAFLAFGQYFALTLLYIYIYNG